MQQIVQTSLLSRHSLLPGLDLGLAERINARLAVPPKDPTPDPKTGTVNHPEIAACSRANWGAGQLASESAA